MIPPPYPYSKIIPALATVARILQIRPTLKTIFQHGPVPINFSVVKISISESAISSAVPDVMGFDGIEIKIWGWGIN